MSGMKRAFLVNEKRLNQVGMSLVEVLVSLGILGVVTASLTAAITNMMAAQKTIEARQNVASLVTEVQALVSNGSTCLSLFGNGTQTFDYNLARSTAGDPVTLTLNGENLMSGSSSNRFDLRISRVYLANGTLAGIDTSARSVYKAQVVGEFQPNASVVRMGGLTDFRPRTMTTGFFTVNGSNQIIGCADLSPVEQSMAADFCNGLGGVYNSSTKKCDSLIDLTQTANAQDICAVTGQTFNSSTGRCDPVVAATTVVVAGGGSGSAGGSGSSGGSSGGAPTPGKWRYVSRAGNSCGTLRQPYNGPQGKTCTPLGTLTTAESPGVFGNLSCTYTYQCR